MSYETFKTKVLALAKATRTKVNFHHDTEKGKFYANCSDVTTIIGNPISLRVTVRYGSGHQMMATI